MTPSLPNARDVSQPLAARRVGWAAAGVALLAFVVFRATLLPGVDFGDTGSFQTTVGSALLTPRVGYPLYFAIGGVFLRLVGGDPAHALNLITAVEGALACGLFVIVAVELSGSLMAAVAGALLFSVSYTFWSQSIIAEVYALHLVLVLASTWLLLRWQRHPSTIRLAAFFLCYAIGFGNHLSMILLAPGFAGFLLWSAPGGWRTMFAPRVVMLAVVCVAIGASQYVWNIRTLWLLIDPPQSLWDGLRTFWFDVTKSDWRDTMILEVPQSLLRDHLAMYWFDLRQQFGLVGPILAAIGVVALWASQRQRAALLVSLYAVCFAFAFSYNVGDTHVFYLPSHLMVALLAVGGIAAIGRLAPHGTLIAALLVAAYAGVRGYRDYPALDRSHDTRPLEVLQAMAGDLDDRRSIVLVDLNWQVANGLSYFAKSVHPEVAAARMRDVLLYVPTLIHDNLEAGRTIALTPQARRILDESYGPMFAPIADRLPATLGDVVRTIAPGTRYVVCILKPSRDMPLDRVEVNAALAALTGGTTVELPSVDYVVVAGVAGRAPTLVEGSSRPFTSTVQLDGVDTLVRMESWLTSDTIRRMGFGHVIVGHRHTLIVERGVSLVAFGADGNPIERAYFSGIFAKPARYFIGPEALR